MNDYYFIRISSGVPGRLSVPFIKELMTVFNFKFFDAYNLVHGQSIKVPLMSKIDIQKLKVLCRKYQTELEI